MKTFTETTYYKITKDVLQIITIPIAIILIGNHFTVKMAEKDQRIAITELILDKMGDDHLANVLSIDMIKLVDSAYSKKLKEIVIRNVMRRYLVDFESSEGKQRHQAVKKLFPVYKTNPKEVIDGVFNKIPDVIEENRKFYDIAMVYFLSKIGVWEASKEQRNILESIRKTDHYDDTTTKVHQYLESALSKMRLIE